MDFMNLGVNEHTHTELAVAGSFRASLNLVFTDQQVLDLTLILTLYCVLGHSPKNLRMKSMV